MRLTDRTRGAFGRHVPVLATAVVATAILAAGAAAPASEPRCAGTSIEVRASDGRDAAIACDGALDAVRFLSAQGLNAGEPIEVRVVTALPEVVGPTATGCYRHSERRAYVLTFAEFRKRGRFLDLPIDRVLYRSLVAHEVAHAIAACNFAVPRPSLAAQEYIAYVAMFATMPEPHHARALARFPGRGFESELAINPTVYQMNPERFGAQAYRHFLAPGNGAAFLHQVLSGRALAWDGPL